MKLAILICFAFLLSLQINAQSNYSIQPKDYMDSSQPTGNQMSAVNKIGGSFRLIEYIKENMKVGATDVVTFHLFKQKETTISFDINCAKKIQLHYEFSDAGKKHIAKINEKEPYYRFQKEVDISKFKDGICMLKVYNENGEVIYTFEFEKHKS